MTAMKDYHDFYFIRNVLLVVYVSEKFRTNSLKIMNYVRVTILVQQL